MSHTCTGSGDGIPSPPGSGASDRDSVVADFKSMSAVKAGVDDLMRVGEQTDACGRRLCVDEIRQSSSVA